MSCSSLSSASYGGGTGGPTTAMQSDGSITSPTCTICIRCLFFWIAVAVAVLLIISGRGQRG